MLKWRGVSARCRPMRPIFPVEFQLESGAAKIRSEFPTPNVELCHWVVGHINLWVDAHWRLANLWVPRLYGNTGNCELAGTAISVLSSLTIKLSTLDDCYEGRVGGGGPPWPPDAMEWLQIATLPWDSSRLVRASPKEILFEDNTILWISKWCPCVSVRWCFIELVWWLKSKTSSSFWVGNQNFITRFQGLKILHQFTIKITIIRIHY